MLIYFSILTDIAHITLDSLCTVPEIVNKIFKFKYLFVDEWRHTNRIGFMTLCMVVETHVTDY